ncbi:peptide-methionine (S)-S-oxide reductase [Candidatus Pacearchaeota archaeon CG10_big_fil_rev_8_21_14_0_10_35_219]|nr:peptide-methionine (S)-S-oxide reductase MsrA [Candidatus Pacearchaeota archaeon]OIO42545.1 MAG: peptide-methionine (S)-S-oxide reductase [Candidatus Pacearchaeota archaeon CG1_02_35_32]PIO07942.1 MAG: peptide-methionine (S)-S-oxide reductase [Candidatus Pacearchaeota archaeon CG10_big_fil_rev_8_21_14_0_10_35_219]PIY81397.1 MAG: peptide-methionine (S)-S-oxide reductase [Candidatus Pacearchaeota archaeon CG_4_10_14_0_8_um_filter_35_169]PIZ80639.1 MAG: peptide-methionine (S)-S-oxide reductase 
MKTEKATFGMGCFWSPQLLFDKTPGVIKTVVGFMDGNKKRFPNPTYQQVCDNPTGYAEVTQITFNPKKISYEKLLDIFWKNHNPTTKNRQGLDIGVQYRSVIFYHNKKQKELAEKTKKEQQKIGSKKKSFFGGKKVVTEIEPAGKFIKADEHHQKYLEKHGKISC